MQSTERKNTTVALRGMHGLSRSPSGLVKWDMRKVAFSLDIQR